MYRKILPSPNSKHGLVEYLSRRGESNLESFHGMLAHFGNCGMRRTLVDNLNLTGTARHNLLIRHKLRLSSGEITTVERKRLPAAYEGIVAYSNHLELDHLNHMARACGISSGALPFQHVEALPPDNGERFFSEYLTWMQETKAKYSSADLCLCAICDTTTTTASTRPMPAIQPQPQVRIGDEETATLTLTPQPQVRVGDEETATPNLTVPLSPTVTQPVTPADLTNQPAAPAPVVQIVPWQYSQPVWYPPPWMLRPPPPSQQQQPQFCCLVYRAWHNAPNRKGRPPHHGRCWRRIASGQTKRKRAENPSGDRLI
jgi:hypothetical protein